MKAQNSEKHIVALGELLIDFTENGLSGQGNPLLEANPGGAPCNVLAMLQKLGNHTSFIGKVGDDSFGHMLKERVAGLGIDCSGLSMDKDVHTTLAFVHTKEDGDRDFSFYRNPGADMCLTKAEVSKDLICNADAFHFGTLSMTHEKVKEATVYAVNEAKKSGALISFDPNLRPLLWESEDDAKEAGKFGFSVCDVLKISDNEIGFYTGIEDYDEGVKFLQEKYGIKLIVLSLGKDGSRAYYADKRIEVAPFFDPNTIETTGAGDTFSACVLHFVLKYGIENLNEEKLREALTFANAAASIITTKKGALCVMPEVKEVEKLIKENGR